MRYQIEAITKHGTVVKNALSVRDAASIAAGLAMTADSQQEREAQAYILAGEIRCAIEQAGFARIVTRAASIDVRPLS